MEWWLVWHDMCVCPRYVCPSSHTWRLIDVKLAIRFFFVLRPRLDGVFMWCEVSGAHLKCGPRNAAARTVDKSAYDIDLNARELRATHITLTYLVLGKALGDRCAQVCLYRFCTCRAWRMCDVCALWFLMRSRRNAYVSTSIRRSHIGRISLKLGILKLCACCAWWERRCTVHAVARVV